MRENESCRAASNDTTGDREAHTWHDVGEITYGWANKLNHADAPRRWLVQAGSRTHPAPSAVHMTAFGVFLSYVGLETSYPLETRTFPSMPTTYLPTLDPVAAAELQHVQLRLKGCAAQAKGSAGAAAPASLAPPPQK